MSIKHICIIGIIIFLTACTSGSGQHPTPTFILAEYATSTLTPQPTDTPTVAPAESATATPQVRHTPTPTRKATATTAPTVAPTSSDVVPTRETPPPTIIPTPSALSGRIAFPVDDGGGYYDVWVVELPPTDAPFLIQSRARQPSFADDGRLLLKMQGSDLGESIGLLDSNYTWLGILNESPEDSYPFWDPEQTRYTFSNSNLVKDEDTAHLAPYIFTACSLQLPKFENDVKCQNTWQFGFIEIGDAPVWTDDDRIVFFSYKGDDGIYFVENASVLRNAGRLMPKQLLVRSNGRPTDTAGSQLFFSAGDIDGNWEAYAINLDGGNLTNLSQSPSSQDGLPTISPDGNWVAFVSDRDGAWGIWVRPLAGGEAVKVVDISQINTNPSPWGIDHRAWMMERISWGP